MTVTSIRAKTAQRMASRGGEGDGTGNATDRLCIDCQFPTSYATLSTYGARCFGCYQAYCREPRPAPERSPQALADRNEIARLGKPLPL